MITRILLAVGACLLAADAARAGSIHAIEFLWETPPKTARARSIAEAFAMDRLTQHRVCWKAGGLAERETAVRIDAIDAAGEIVHSVRYTVVPDESMTISCRPAGTGDTEGAVPGHWTYRIHLDGQPEAQKRIPVGRTLEEMPRFDNPQWPYVRGRTTFKPEYAEDYRGTITIELTVNAEGTVNKTEIHEATGATDVALEAAKEAGPLFRFPPDPGRRYKPLRIRQTYELKPGRGL